MNQSDTNKAPQIIPTIGRIVEYVLTNGQANQINSYRRDFALRAAWYSALRPGAQAHHGNAVHEGDVFPAMIVKTWGDTPEASVNLKVFLDGTDTYWATSVHVGDKPGDFRWMPFQKGQAAKTEAAEAKLAQQEKR